MKYLITIFCLFFIPTLHAQPAEWKALNGKWQVEKRILLDSTVFAGSKEGRKVADAENKECLTGVFTFADNGVTVDKEVCDFENCTAIAKDIVLKHIKVNKSPKYIYDIPGDEIEEDDVVGEAFLKLIGLTYAKILTVLTIECDNEEMDDVLVCPLGRDRAALYYDDNLLLLKRAKWHHLSMRLPGT